MDGTLLKRYQFYLKNLASRTLGTVGSFVSRASVSIALPVREEQPVDQSRKIAQLSYHLQSQIVKSDAIQQENGRHREATVEDSLLDLEYAKFDEAVKAAKCGATVQQISEDYGMSDSEAYLIVSLHGSRDLNQSKRLH